MLTKNGEFGFLAFVAGVSGLTNRNSCSAPTITINNAADLSSLASCSTISGDLVFADKYSDTTAQLSGVDILQGSLIVKNAARLQSLSIELTSIGKDFVLQNLPSLSDVSIQQLSSVGNITWADLPMFKSVEALSHPIDTTNLHIIKTMLPGLNNLDIISTGDLQIIDNSNYVNVSSQSTTANQIYISGNGISGEATGSMVSFPNLINTGPFSIQGSSEITAPVLETTGDLALANNYQSSLSLPSLTTIQGQLTINGAFSSIDFPKLTRVQNAFSIQNAGPATPSICSAFATFQHNATMLPSGEYTCSTISDGSIGSGAPAATTTVTATKGKAAVGKTEQVHLG